MKLGIIDYIHLKIPWTNLYQNPVQLNISGVYILANPQSQAQWKYLDENYAQSIHNSLVSEFELMKETVKEKLEMKNNT